MPKKNEQMTRREQLPAMQMRAAIVPSSVNEEDRTVKVQYTTGQRVLRRRFFQDDFLEELSTEKGHVRLGRLNNGAPVLNSHSHYRLESVLGVVEQSSADEQYATLRFSDREDVEPFWRDVKNGIIRNVSVGYVVHKFEDVTEKGDDIKVLRAVDWEPLEISMVAIGADAGASVRSGETFDCTIVANKAEQIENERKETEMPQENTNPASDATRNNGPHTHEIPSNDPGQSTDHEKIRKEGIEAERKRASEIRSSVRKAKLSDEFAERLIEEGVSIEDARAKIIDKWEEGGDKEETRSNVSVGEDLSRAGRTIGAENALAHRFNPSIELTEEGREWRGMTLMEMAREFLSENGEKVRGLSKSEIAIRALHSTSDFPEILANTANKSLRDAYGNVVRTFTPWARATTLPDFKEISRVALSEAPSLTRVIEGGEYKYGEFGENAEKYRLFTYGKIVAITRETIINDDLDAFTRVPNRMGAAASRLESDLVYGILTSNPNMADGNALFSAQHKNTTNELFGVNGLGTLRKLMRVQKGLASKDPLNTNLKFIMVPSALETEAEKLLGRITPQGVQDVNPFANRVEMIVEARLDDSSPLDYYGAADPNEIDTIEYAYLEGETGPYIESREGFSRDGMEIKVRHDFAAKAVDFRGLAKSTNNKT